MPIILKPFIEPEILRELKSEISNEKQVIVHCCFPATPSADLLVRIWASTFLIDKSLAHKSSLIHHENISLYPYWTEVPPMKDFWFTLVFSGLPKACKCFDLKEVIPQENGFWVKNIIRNGTDIYKVKIN